MTKKTIIPINGMYCASCAMTIENALQKTEGVSEARVNIATEKAVVEYDSSKVTLERLGEVI